MSEAHQPVPQQDQGAGALLRAAREAAGVHIGVLSTTLKVPVRKLELLEAGRFDELPDATFVRALALSVCRVLKCNPAPVLEALPRQEHLASTLEQVTQGVNTPFSRRDVPAVKVRASARRWVWSLVALIVVLAALAWWLPLGGSATWSGMFGSAAVSGAATGPQAVEGQPSVVAVAGVTPVTAPAAAVSGAAVATAALVQTVHGAPEAAAAGASDAGPTGGAGAMASAISVTEASWVEATDLQGRPVWTRTLTPGEVVDLGGHPGLRLTIGNAAATQLRWRGRVIDLAGSTRDNVARLELK